MESKGKEKRRRIGKESVKEEGNKRGRQNDASEEEVEEFFAILRRMQVAVKYFDKGNGEGWRAAVEAEVVAVVGSGGLQEDDEDEKKKKMEVTTGTIVHEEGTGVLDLNALPDVETD